MLRAARCLSRCPFPKTHTTHKRWQARFALPPSFTVGLGFPPFAGTFFSLPFVGPGINHHPCFSFPAKMFHSRTCFSPRLTTLSAGRARLLRRTRLQLSCCCCCCWFCWRCLLRFTRTPMFACLPSAVFPCDKFPALFRECYGTASSKSMGLLALGFALLIFPTFLGE